MAEGSNASQAIIHAWLLKNITAECVPADEGNGDALLYNLLATLHDGPHFEPYAYLESQNARLRAWRDEGC